MGDAAEELKVLYMHSAAKTQLEKDLLIKPVVLPNTNITLPSYLGYIVLSDDSVPYKKIEGGKAKTFYVELEMTEETKKKTEARQAARERAAAEAKERAEAAKKTTESQPEEETQTSESRPEATETLGDAK